MGGGGRERELKGTLGPTFSAQNFNSEKKVIVQVALCQPRLRVRFLKEGKPDTSHRLPCRAWLEKEIFQETDFKKKCLQLWWAVRRSLSTYTAKERHRP